MSLGELQIKTEGMALKSSRGFKIIRVENCQLMHLFPTRLWPIRHIEPGGLASISITRRRRFLGSPAGDGVIYAFFVLSTCQS